MSSVWTGNKNNKDVTSSRKDLRLHPNFRLIPQLHECSNAIKLDSLSGTYGVYPWIALVGLKRNKNSRYYDECCVKYFDGIISRVDATVNLITIFS